MVVNLLRPDVVNLTGLCNNPDRTEFCPFCKKIKFRKCHKKVFNELSQIKQIIELDIVPIFNLFIGFPEYILPQNK